MSKKKERSGGFPIFLFIIILIVAATIFVLGYLGFDIPLLGFTKSNKFEDALNEYNYQAAATIFNASYSKDAELSFLDEHLNYYFELCFSDDYTDTTWSSFRGIEVFNEHIKEKVLAKMDETVTRFYNDEFSQEDAKKYISRLGKFSFADKKTTDCIISINEKELSVESYNQGIILANEGKYEEAVSALKKVSSLDSQHYSAAQNAIETCKERYGAPKIQEAQNLIDTNQTDSAKKILKSLISLFEDYPEAQALLDTIE